MVVTDRYEPPVLPDRTNSGCRSSSCSGHCESNTGKFDLKIKVESPVVVSIHLQTR